MGMFLFPSILCGFSTDTILLFGRSLKNIHFMEVVMRAFFSRFPSSAEANALASEDAEILLLTELLSEVLAETQLYTMRDYTQHGNTDTLLHSIAVAYFSLLLARRWDLQTDRRAMVVGALLHDYCLYDWHVPDPSHRLHGLFHPFTALKNARAHFAISEREADIISRHMFPLVPIPPRYRESAIVCLVDKACSLYETFTRNPYPKLRALFDL